MAYRKINTKGSESESGGVILKWKNIGQEAEGRFDGFRAGKYGPQSLLIIDGQQYASATVLKSALEETPVGAKVKIVYLGKERSAGGAEYLNFDVFVDQPETEPQSVGLKAATVTNLTNQQLFDLLLIKIQSEKGPVIAGALKAATIMSKDPLSTLREAAAQVGVDPIEEEVPF